MKTHIFGGRQTIADNAPITTCCRTCAKKETCKGVPDFPKCDRDGWKECDVECNAECGEWVKQEDVK